MKWGLWIMHKLLLTAVYGYILFVHFSKWREKLPREYINVIVTSLFLDWTYLSFPTLQPDQHSTTTSLWCLLLMLHHCLLVCLLELGQPLAFGTSKLKFIYKQKKVIHSHILLALTWGVVLFICCRLFNFLVVCYHSLYLPFIYVTFVADFFQVIFLHILWLTNYIF